MTSYEQLDYILKKCRTICVINTLPREMGITKERVDALIKRLKEDGYIIASDIYGAESYCQTLEGEIFIGYTWDKRWKRIKFFASLANIITILTIALLALLYQIKESNKKDTPEVKSTEERCKHSK